MFKSVDEKQHYVFYWKVVTGKKVYMKQENELHVYACTVGQI